jgi:pimeloyl-ACP methyl ester carboxylesterase
MLRLLPVEEQKNIFNRFVCESGRAAFEIGFWFLDRKGASRVDEANVTCPILVVAGGQDRITPASVVRKVAAKYRATSTYKEFPNHAHWVIGEPQWQEVAEHVSHWLEHVQA